MDLATERKHLAKSERDIAEGERRIAQQTELLEQLHRKGAHDVTEAERLLETLKDTLEAWRDHHAIIVRTIADMESGALPSRPAPKPSASAWAERRAKEGP